MLHKSQKRGLALLANSSSFLGNTTRQRRPALLASCAFAASALTMASVGTVLTPTTALAFTCTSTTAPAGGNSGANDAGDVKNTACGTNAVATDLIDSGSAAFGANTQATKNSTALGNNAQATGTASIAINAGIDGSFASGTFSIAIGEDAKAKGNGSIAIAGTTGLGSTANGTNSVAILGATSAGDNSIAFGVSSATTVAATNSIAFGSSAQAQSTNTVAIGKSAQARSAPPSPAPP